MESSSTENLCRQACIYAGAELGKKYSNMFDSVFFLEGRPKENGFRRNSQNADWAYHYYLIIKSKDKFFACAPSNYTANSKSNPLTSIITSDSLEELFEEIEVIEDGDWNVARLDNQWDETYNPYKQNEEGKQMEREQRMQSVKKLIDYFQND